LTDHTLKKSSLFLLELIIVLFFFSLCTAICVNIFAKAKTLSTQSYELNNSVLVVQNAAECFKATDADAREIALLLGGIQNNNVVSVTYNENWNTTKSSNYTYKLIININTTQKNMASADLNVIKNTATLYSLSVSTLFDAGKGD